MAKVGFYIDGFNMFHALDALNKPHLKWLDLRKLAEHVAGKDDDVVRVVYCTATRTDDVEKMLRHRAYIKALTARNVECVIGHFVDEDRDCRNCGREWKAPVEKQSDVSLALSVLDDAHQGLIDKAYLVTADSDQVATILLFKRRFPTKTILSVPPPKKYHHPKLRDAAHGTAKIDVSALQLCLLPKVAGDVKAPVIRPAVYDPPEEVGKVSAT